MTTVPPSTPDTHPAAAPAEPERPVFDDPQVGRVGKLVQRIERKVSRLSTKNNFWHRSIARIFLPLAYRSGITFRKQALSKDGEFECVVPFSRFNKNWYNAMAGAALLANSEVAGGMYIFKRCGSDYTVVCKHLEYKFRRPCVGPRHLPRHPPRKHRTPGGHRRRIQHHRQHDHFASRRQKRRKRTQSRRKHRHLSRHPQSHVPRPQSQTSRPRRRKSSPPTVRR